MQTFHFEVLVPQVAVERTKIEATSHLGGVLFGDWEECAPQAALGVGWELLQLRLLGRPAVSRCMPLAPQSEAAVWLLSRTVCSLAVVDHPEMQVGYPASPACATEWHREAKSMLW